jgi:hypothetical protein
MPSRHERGGFPIGLHREPGGPPAIPTQAPWPWFRRRSRRQPRSDQNRHEAVMIPAMSVPRSETNRFSTTPRPRGSDRVGARRAPARR